MECVEAAALKTSLRRDSFGGRGSPHPQAFFVDEFNAPAPCGVPSDDFSVDELLDFSNENGFVDEGKEEEERRVQDGEAEQSNNDGKASVSGFCEMDDFPAVPAGDLSVPADDAADLEWLSHFVEDSSEYSAPFPAGMLPEKPRSHQGSENWAKPEKPGSERPYFTTPVPAKARSKRARTGGWVWSLGSPSLSESSATSSSSSSTTSSSPSSPWLLCTNFGLIEPVYGKPPAKKPKRKLKQPAQGPGMGQPPRRCSHCGVQKTPQWRAGPLGAKTLCNACGVRFKSGRLLPEYRPACSPTFSSELHSNHHRKVLEMRRKKEMLSGPPESALAVPSF
ncbi:hypothetical protein CDL15_Pgr020833 [Punica granatum]|nr:hypothetical protein CDL15_Pgr020833 [Punica granatum]PKI48419.1 hypothetical protein CRG98_031171 [Punica granatum]